VDDVIARMPEHADALREDLRLTVAVRNYARTVGPSPSARAGANQRLMASLQEQRIASASTPVREHAWWGGALPRFAIAAAVVVVAFVAFAALDRGNGPTVEAATIEGVVLENEGGSLTVQTLDALEEVTIPSDAAVSDASGAPINVAGITPGEVVVIHAQRRGDAVVAQQVARLVDNIEAWCNDDSARCEVLTDRLRDLEANCEEHPVSCRIAVHEINQLRMRAAETARMESLKNRCRGGGPLACDELASFCSDHRDLCANVAPFIPAPNTELRERVRQLLQSCQQGDASACRQLTQVCQDNAGVCPNAPSRPNPNTSSTQPTVTPVARTVTDSPTATPGTQRPVEPTATEATQRPASATATPVSQRDSAPPNDRTR
jgi:hypothetical protein